MSCTFATIGTWQRDYGNARSQRTREQIIESAMRLFAERGYHATTIADIAEAAEVAPRTFFSYFPSKEAVVFHEAERDLDGLASTLSDRLPGESAFDALRRWIDTIFDERLAEEDEALLRKRLCREDEGLANFQGGLMARIHELLLAAIADDLDEPPDALRPRLVAAAALAALTSLDRSFDEKADQRAPVDKSEALAVLDDALVFLRAGLDALQDK
jgi:AcrR family transcriptional regulator